MKFQIQVNNGADTWWEEYDKDVSDPEKCAREMVARFNSTLRPNERSRILLAVEMINPISQKEHTWVKQNLVTVVSEDGYHDVMECEHCGITGKRYTLGGYVDLDYKYRRAKVYQRCDTAKAHLARLKRKAK